MKNMTLRGKKFIKKSADVTFAVCIITAVLIFSIWMIICELNETHNTNTFKYIIIISIVLGIISCIAEYVSEKFRREIRRDIKAEKAKTWWLN